MTFPFLVTIFTLLSLSSACSEGVRSLSDHAVHALCADIIQSHDPHYYLPVFDATAVWMSPGAREQLLKNVRQELTRQLSPAITRLQTAVKSSHALGFRQSDQSYNCCFACQQASAVHAQLRALTPEQLLFVLACIKRIHNQQEFASFLASDASAYALYTVLAPEIHDCFRLLADDASAETSSECQIV